MKTLRLNLFLFLALQQPAAPPLLLQALQSEPGLRLLAPASDLRDYSQEALQKFGYWPPWLELDLDRDKRPDIAAVIVKPSKNGFEFGVVAVHARAPGELQWVVPLDVDPINGIAKGPAADTVVPLFCVECDANTWMRWSGEEYEPELYAAGERLDVGSETQADLPLYTSPNRVSKPVTSVPHCTTVVVREVGGTPDERWYFVEAPDGQRGWISDRLVSGGICVG